MSRIGGLARRLARWSGLADPRVVGAVAERRSTYDAEADAAYVAVAPSISAGEAAETVVIDRPFGTVVLDFDSAGHLLGIEVVGARALLTQASIDRLHPLS